MRRPLSVTLLLALATSACAVLFSMDDGRLREDAGVDGGADEGGSLGEAGVPPCDPSAKPPANAIYVSKGAVTDDGGTDGGGSAPNGSADAPFPKIGGDAIAKARIFGGTIVLDEGTYEESLTLESIAQGVGGVAIDGAWRRVGTSWVRNCDADRRTKTIIRGTTDVAVRIRNNGSVPVSLSNLTIESQGPSAPQPNTPGASRYGLFVEASTVKLDGVAVIAMAANPGGTAANGPPGTATCATSTTCTQMPMPGNTPAPAAPASTFGTFTAAGFVPADGNKGGPGTPGSSGTPGGPGSSRSDCWSGCAAKPSCENANAPKTVTGSIGQCGCGGGGGQPGDPGRGGGASVAIYAVGATTTVLIENSDLVSGAGGAGSAGGFGGAGAPGTQGAKGADGDCYENRCCRVGNCTPDPNNCGCYGGPNWDMNCGTGAPVNNKVSGGSAGGPGAKGGDGAKGGGGAGGPSFVLVKVDGASVLPPTASRLTWGVGGTGAEGAPSGPSGAAWPP
jgi:hypothetical protein